VMATVNTAGADIVIRDRNNRLGLQLDAGTGLPTAVLFRQGEHEVSLPLGLTATLVTEGDEVRRAASGVDDAFGYVKTTDLGSFRRSEQEPRYHLNGPEETYTVATEVGEWTVLWHYTFRQSHP